MKRVLLVAFHFPPFGASSGLHRSLALARHLPRFGWEPLVLTASLRAYPSISASPEELPQSLVVRRAFAVDAARTLAVRGRYLQTLALPDRWSSWLLGALPAGLGMVRRHRPQLIWTTYPLATAHLIGAALARATGLPWVADFRDPMVEHIDGRWFPENATMRRARLFVERRVAQRARGATFCTPTALRIFSQRHAGQHRGEAPQCEVIENGYEPEAFEAALRLPSRRLDGLVHLVHSGVLYPGPDRDPSGLFRAIARLKEQNRLRPNLRITLRATGFDAVYREQIGQLNLNGIIELAPSVDYATALREMLDADGLLLFQGRTSNPAIPAKTYEYLRAGRPILGLVAEDGETAALLRRAGVDARAPIDDVERISAALEAFLNALPGNTVPATQHSSTEQYSRVHRVREFAHFFDRIAGAS